MICASDIMLGFSTPKALQDGKAGKNANSELLDILFRYARCTGSQIFNRFYVSHGIFFCGFHAIGTLSIALIFLM